MDQLEVDVDERPKVEEVKIDLKDQLKTALEEHGLIKEMFTIEKYREDYALEVLRTKNHPVTTQGSEEEIKRALILIEIESREADLYQKISELNIPQERKDAFMSLKRGVQALRKIKVPTNEELETWGALPKEMGTLRKVKLPILIGWTVEQVIEASAPLIDSLASKYSTKRCDKYECRQNGKLGVIQALKTDAGISVFSQHAFGHIRTNIRRNSATSGVIHQKEAMPSKTEVRRELTNWMRGTWAEMERDKLASALIGKGKSYNHVMTKYGWATQRPEINSQKREIVGETPDYFDITTTGGKVRRVRKIKLGQDFGLLSDTEKKEVNKAVAATLKRLTTSSVINNKNLIPDPDSIEWTDIQMTGQHAAEQFVKSTYQICDLPLDVLSDLLEYLVVRFSPTEWGKSVRGEPVRKLPIVIVPDKQRFQSVADVVNFFAKNPDFQGNPVSMSSRGGNNEESGSLEETISGKNAESTYDLVRHSEVTRLVSNVMSKLEIPPDRRAILNHLYGLNGAEILTGAEIADSYGKITGVDASNPDKPPKKVSRQRITQIQADLEKKIAEAIFEHLFIKRCDSKKAIERAIDQAVGSPSKEERITNEEKMLLVLFYGLFGTPHHDADFLASRYEQITSVNLPPHPHATPAFWPENRVEWGMPERRGLVKMKMDSAKAKLVKTILYHS